jgi:uncharacterized glyoxalase superfamily protein PhnB
MSKSSDSNSFSGMAIRRFMDSWQDRAKLNLRVVHNLPFNQIERAAEQLLSAYIPVSDVKAWFLEFTERGANFLQTLQSQPWGTSDFIVEDTDGNLLSFGSRTDENEPN